MSRGVWILLLASLVGASVLAQGNKKVTLVPTPVPVAGPVATVNGETISTAEFLSISDTYVGQAREQAARSKAKFTPAEETSVRLNILGELINDHLWMQEARRRGMAVPDSAVDNRLRQNAFFRTNGKVDEQKWQAYRTAPQSNYKELLVRMHNGMLIERLFSALEKQYTPDDKTLRAEFAKQNQSMRAAALWIRPEPGMLEDELSHAEVQDFYSNHPSDFEFKEQRNALAYFFPVGGPQDSTWEQSRVRADSLLRRVKLGAPLDSSTAPTAMRVEIGWFPRGQAVPRLRMSRAMSDSVFNLKPGDAYPELVIAPRGYGVMTVTGAKPSSMRSLRSAWAEVYRLASTEKKKLSTEQDMRGRYTNFPDRYRTRRAHMKALYFDPRAWKPAGPPKPEELRRLYDIHASAFVVTDSTGIPKVRPYAEVESTVVRRYPEWMADSVTVRDWNAAYAAASAGRDVFTTPPPGALVRDFPSVTTTFDDSILTPAIVDVALSLRPGQSQKSGTAVRGWMVYKVLSNDSTYLPPFEEVKMQVQKDLNEEKRTERETRARAYYDAHKADFMSDTLYVIKYAGVRRPQPKELGLDEARSRAWYRRTIQKYTSTERARLQALVLTLLPTATPADRKAAVARADSLRARALRGEDFAELARQYSEDPGSAKRGGDIGFQTRESLRDTTIGNPAFRLRNGQTSAPILTPRGVILFRCIDYAPTTVQPYESVHDQVFDDASATLGDSAAQRIAERAMREGNTPALLEERAIHFHGGPLSQSQPFQLKETVFNLGDLPEVKAEIPHMKKGQVGKKGAKGPGNYLMWMLYDILPPAPLSWEKAKDLAMQRMDKETMLARVKVRVDTLQARLLRGDSLSEAGYDLGMLTQTGSFQRGGFIPGFGSAALADTFLDRARPGDISGAVQMPENTGGGVAFLQFLGSDALDDAAFDKQKKFLADRLVQEKKQATLDRMRKEARVTILRREYKAAWAPQAGQPAGTGVNSAKTRQGKSREAVLNRP